MNITATYKPTALELAHASSLFIEKKPFLRFAVGLINLFAGILVVIFVTKLFYMGISLQEWSALVIGLLWIFGRRPFNEWLLYRKMCKSMVLDKQMTIAFSRNGIIWSGEALKNGQMSWAQIKYIMIAQNGMILPQTATRFLWVPFRAFDHPDDIEFLRAFAEERHIHLRSFPKWIC
jgi:hypothetical protein